MKTAQRFKGLEQASKDFKKFSIKGYIQDPAYGYQHVFLIRLRFRGYDGLCIYSTLSQSFISEPSDLDAYGYNSLKELSEKYPRLFTAKELKSINK